MCIIDVLWLAGCGVECVNGGQSRQSSKEASGIVAEGAISRQPTDEESPRIRRKGRVVEW